MIDPRLQKLARTLVNYSVAVRPGDLVRIDGSPLAEGAIVAVYEQVLAAGGHPVVRMQPEICTELLLRGGSDEQVAFVDPFELHETKKIDVRIGIWAEENSRALSTVDAARQARHAAARKPILDLFLRRAGLAADDRRKLRWVGTDVPCQAAAQDAQMSLREYEGFVYAAGLLHLDDPAAEWRKIGTRQQRLCDFLDRAREIRFCTPRGTDIRLGVEGRRWINCDGHENFPDGEVFTGPIEDSVDGEVRFDFPAVYQSREATDVRLVFRRGKVVDASASRGEDFLHRMLESDPGARRLGEVALGTNYAIGRFTRNLLFDEKIGGTFHLALGGGYPESGSKNRSGIHWDMVADLKGGGTVLVDGKPISKDGRFTRRSWPQPAEMPARR